MFAGRGSKRVAQMARRHPSLGSSSIAVTAETWHRVVDHMDLPEVSPRAHRRGALWGVALVKDEEDVIEAVIRHHFAQGLDAIVVADNGSTDSTPAILRRLRHEFPLYIARDRLFAYEQAAKLSCLAHLAGAARAGWVVPFDADEFWFGAAGGRLGHTLRSTDDDVTVLSAEMHNVFPLAGLAPGATLGEREFRLCLHPSSHMKVAFRPHPDAMLSMGSHDVARTGERALGLTLLHLPWRSREQMATKARKGVAALDAGRLAPEVGHHWRTLAAGGEEGFDAVWAAITSGVDVPGLEWGPEAPMVITRPFNPAQHWYHEVRPGAADANP